MTEENSTPLNESYLLDIGWSDPGPDTVTATQVIWGDGATDSPTSPFTQFAHVYATDGIVVQSARVTDEDGTWGIDRYFNAGDTDAPQPPDLSPILNVTSVTITSNGNALLQLEAFDESGQPLSVCAWDTDVDGSYDLFGSCGTGLIPTTNHYAFEVAVKLVDSFGNTTERLILFNDATDVYVGWWVGYREDFETATPDLPADWQVHHSYAQRAGELKLRYKFEGINVDDVQHLRGVPKEIHDEITQLQEAWWKAQEVKTGIQRPQVYWHVDFAEIKQFDEDVDDAHKKWMIRAGDKSDAVSKVRTILKQVSGKFEFLGGKAKRWERVGLKVGSVVGLIAAIGSNAKTLAKVATFDSGDADFQAFFQSYSAALEAASSSEDGKISKQLAHEVRTSFVTWLTSIDQGDAGQKINALMFVFIELRTDLFITPIGS
jgi:hypothetical protein